MSWQIGPRFARTFIWSSFVGGVAMTAVAQEPINFRPSPAPVAVTREAEDLPPPVSPAVSPGPMSLDACLALGFGHQPAIDAAQASLNAAQSGKRAVDRLIIPRLFMKDLPIRRAQACEGVSIAAAGLTQAEWETRYSITRNYFTVQYIRSQGKVINEVLGNLTKARERAGKIFEKPPVDSKITTNDLHALDIQLAMVKGKKSQIDNGMLKALAALREAMGLGYDYPLEIAVTDLPPAVIEKGPKDKIEYVPVYQFNKGELIASALANRPEMAQASGANRLMELEIQAQRKILGWQGKTFGAGSDPHAKQIPQGIFNNEYRPGAIGIEIPGLLPGRKGDRVDRVIDLKQRTIAVVDKTTNLVSLDVEAQYLKWQEALEEIRDLTGIQEIARNLPDNVNKLYPNDPSNFAIINANLMAITVRVQLNDAMHMHALALAGLERATAGAFRVFPYPAPK